MKRHDDDYYQQAVLSYYQRKQTFEQQKAEFEVAKSEFEETMMECCSESKSKHHKFVVNDLGSSDAITVSVAKVEKTSIEWFAEKLEKRITRSVAGKVIRKEYVIVNWSGMVQYLKSLGAKPDEFKRYIRVDKTVDEKAVDHLGDIGELTPRDIAGCYLVKSQKPYFTISVKKGDDDEG